MHAKHIDLRDFLSGRASPEVRQRIAAELKDPSSELSALLHGARQVADELLRPGPAEAPRVGPPSPLVLSAAVAPGEEQPAVITVRARWPGATPSEEETEVRCAEKGVVVRDVLATFAEQRPAGGAALFEQGQPSARALVQLNGTDIRALDGLATAVQAGDVVSISLIGTEGAPVDGRP